MTHIFSRIVPVTFRQSAVFFSSLLFSFSALAQVTIDFDEYAPSGVDSTIIVDSEYQTGGADNTNSPLPQGFGFTVISQGGDNPTPNNCLLYTSPSPRDKRQSRMPSSA